MFRSSVGMRGLRIGAGRYGNTTDEILDKLATECIGLGQPGRVVTSACQHDCGERVTEQSAEEVCRPSARIAGLHFATLLQAAQVLRHGPVRGGRTRALTVVMELRRRRWQRALPCRQHRDRSHRLAVKRHRGPRSPFQTLHQRRQRRRSRDQRLQRRKVARPAGPHHERGGEKLLFAAEVAEQRSLGDACGAGNGLGGHTLVPVLLEQVGGAVEDVRGIDALRSWHGGSSISY